MHSGCGRPVVGCVASRCICGRFLHSPFVRYFALGKTGLFAHRLCVVFARAYPQVFGLSHGMFTEFSPLSTRLITYTTKP